MKECESTTLWEPTTTPGADTADKDKDDADLAARTKKQSDVLIELAQSAKFFHTPDDRIRHLDVNGHRETWPIRRKGFKRWLARRFYESTQARRVRRRCPRWACWRPGPTMMHRNTSFIFGSPATTAGSTSTSVTQTWRAVEIDAAGWRVINNPPVRFRRTAGMKALPAPVPGGSLEGDFRPFLNVEK